MGLFAQKGEKFYRQGRETNDLAKAVDCFQKAVAQGHQGAAWLLGDMYAAGNAVLPRDGKKAAEIYAIITEPIGKFKLGQLYYHGNGVERDFKKAHELFTQALTAKKFSVYAAEGYFGGMHFWGEYLEQDYRKAAEYLKEYIKTEQWQDPDLDYCYAHMRYHGLGGLKQDQAAAAADMVEIARCCHEEPIRRRALEAVWDYYHNLDLDECSREIQKSRLAQLSSAARSGSAGCACTLARFYLTHTCTTTTGYRDRATGVTEIFDETVRDMWEEAAEILEVLYRVAPRASAEERAVVARFRNSYGPRVREHSQSDYEKLKALAL